MSISRHLSLLVDRNVATKVVTVVDFSPETCTACYMLEPNLGNAVVQMDFHLMASLAGTMIGFVPAVTEAQIRTGELDENLTDASGEMMNVLAAAIVSEGRAIFKGLFRRRAECSAEAQELLLKGMLRLKLLVTPIGGKAGYMQIVSDV